METQWKRRVSQTGLAALLATMVFGAIGSANAAEPTQTQPQSSEQTTVTQPAVKISTAFSSGTNLLLQPAFQRNYWKLLAATYAPETSAEWKQALEERKQLESEMPQPKEVKNFTVTENAENAEKAAEALPALPALPTAPTITITPSVKDGTSDPSVRTKRIYISIMKNGASSKDLIQALPVEGIAVGDIIKADETEAFKRQQKLAEAVEADDAEAIRSLLSELLVDYRNETESLRNAIKNVQKEVPQP